MNIENITSMVQDIVSKNKGASGDVINEGFSTILISEMLKSSDIYKEENGLSYPSMFRWQMAQHLAKALKDKIQVIDSSIDEACGDLKSIASSVARKEGVDEDIVKAVISVESAWDQNAVSHAGAKGLMQLIDDTAEHFGVKDVFNPVDNIRGGVKFLKHLIEKYDNDLTKVFAAYNAGEGAVAKYGGVPPYKETQNYVEKVMLKLNNLQDSKKIR